MSTSGQDATSRLSQLGKALKKLLDPNQDRLLPGYAELIQLMKSTTVAAREERKEEEKKYYEAQIARFNKDRRQYIKKDDEIRDFLLQRKVDIYQIIENNMKKIKVFPENPSLIEHMTVEEKIQKIQKKLRNPQVEILTNYVRNSKKDSSIPAHLSPATRKKMIVARRRYNSQEAGKQDAQGSDDELIPKTMARNRNAGKEQHDQYIIQETRDLQLSDLAAVLEDLEVIELETEISKQELNAASANQKADATTSKSKKMLDHLLERPSLSELLYRSVERQDIEAARKAEIKFNQMLKNNYKNLANRVNMMIGISPPSQSLQQNLNQSNNVSNADTNSQYDIGSPSRHSKQEQAANQVVTNDSYSKYIPYENMITGRSKSVRDDSYRCRGIEAILQSANNQYKFNEDIDNSEEEELSDDELRLRIKERKYREKSRRDDLKTVKIAALQTASTVSEVRKQIGIGSIVTAGINLEALKQRQAKLREKIHNDNNNDTTTPMMTMTDGFEGQGSSPNQRYSIQGLSGEQITFGEGQFGTGLNYQRQLLLEQDGYEPCQEQEDGQSSGTSIDSVGRKKPKAHLDPVEALRRQMQKFQTCETDTPDTLDLQKLQQVQFKASFMSHICAVKDRKDQYEERLRNFDHKKSTKGNVVNQPYHEKRIYQQLHRQASSKSVLDYQQDQTSRVPSSIHIETVEGEPMENKRSQSSFTTHSVNLSMSKNPTLTQDRNVSPPMIDPQTTSPSKDAAPFISSSANVIYQTQSHPALGMSPTASPPQKRLGLINRGLDLSCVNSSQLAVTPKPNQIIVTNESIQKVHNSQMMQLDKQLALSSKSAFNPANDADPVQNQFSTLSLCIVLSPRGQQQNGDRDGSHEQPSGSHNVSPKKGTKQINKRVVPKQQESTVTVLGKNHHPAGREALNESLLLQNENKESQQNMLALFQQASISRSLSGSKSSASQQVHDAKLQATEGQTMQKSMAQLNQQTDRYPLTVSMINNDKNTFGNIQSQISFQNALSGAESQQKLTNSNHRQAESMNGMNHDQIQQTIRTQQRQPDASQNSQQQLGSQAILDKKSSDKDEPLSNKLASQNMFQKDSPTASKVNFVELPQQPITQISFEKSGQNVALATQRERYQASNVAPLLASSKVTTHSDNSPYFVMSPREAAANTQMDSLAGKQISQEGALAANDSTMKMYGDQKADRQRVQDSKSILATTQFDFPIPQQSVEVMSIVDDDQKKSFKNKMMRRFGGTVSYWQGSFKSTNKVVNEEAVQEQMMIRTFQEVNQLESSARRQQAQEDSAVAAAGPSEPQYMNIQSNGEIITQSKITVRSPSDRQYSVLAKEFSLESQSQSIKQQQFTGKAKKGGRKGKKASATNKAMIFEEMLRARTNLLGPTEYLQLSSGASSNTPERNNINRRHHVIIQDAHDNNLNSKHITTSQIKNVVKLELNERQNSKESRKSKSKSPISGWKNRKSIETVDSKDDNKSDNVDGLEFQGAHLQPIMIDSNSKGSLARITIPEDKALGGDISSPIQTHIQYRKKSNDSNQMVETQGLASHLHLHDAATSPAQIWTKPNSPEQTSSKNLPVQKADFKKQPVKGLSNMGLNRFLERLELQPQQMSMVAQNLANQAPTPHYIAANNMRKLSISILTTGDVKDEKEKLQSALRVSPSNHNKNSVTISGASPKLKGPLPHAISNVGRYELTPHLQSTNVKIALQKEKSKRMIQILSKKNSGFIGDSEQNLKHRLSQSIGNLNQKQSSPFLQPKQIDLGLNLDQDFKVSQFKRQNVRKTQDYKANEVVMVNKGTSNMSQHPLNTNLSTNNMMMGEEDNHLAQAGEFAMDSQGQFVKVVKRNPSQENNPLLDCSEEDENNLIERPTPCLNSQPQSTEGKRLVTLIGNSDVNQILKNPEQMIPKNLQKQLEMRQNSAGQNNTYQQKQQSLVERNAADLINPMSSGSCNPMMNQVMTPSQPNETLAQGLGGEDIITDGASQIRIEQDIKEMQGLLPPLLDTTSTKHFFKNDDIRLEGEDQKKQLQALKKNYKNDQQNDSIPLQYVRDNSKLTQHTGTSGIEFHRGSMNKSKLLRQQAQLRQKGEKSPGSTTIFNHNEMLTTGIKYSPTPLSVLQENPLQSDLVNQNRFRRSVHGSKVSISVIKNQMSANRNSQVIGGPYVKSFTQRIKLPNLNRSQYASIGRSREHNAPQHEAAIGAAGRSNPRSSVVSKQNNNVFTMRDSDLAQGETSMTKHIANNFRVKIKNQLNQSVNHSLNQSLCGDIDSNKHQFRDLHHTARNSGSFGVHVSSGLHSSVKNSKHNRGESLDPHNRLKSQILVYGQGSDIDSAKKKMLNTSLTIGASRGRNQATGSFMHQTLTQVLMPPINTVTPQIRKSLPPKSLLFKGQNKAQHSGANGGSKTTRVSPKHNEPAATHNTVSNFAGGGIRTGRLSPGGGDKAAQNQIESGSMELSVQKKVRLAADIHESLLPLHLPLMDSKRSPNAEAQPSQAINYDHVKSKTKDASTRVKMGSVNPDQSSSIADKEALQSQGSSFRGAQMSIVDSSGGGPATQISQNGETRRHSAEDAQKDQLIARSQVSQDTHKFAKQSSVVEVSQQNQKGLQVHMFDESKSTIKTAIEWSKGISPLAQGNTNVNIITKEEDCQTNFQEVPPHPFKQMHNLMQVMEGKNVPEDDDVLQDDSDSVPKRNQLILQKDVDDAHQYSSQLQTEEDELILRAKQLFNSKVDEKDAQTGIDVVAESLPLTKQQQMFQDHEMTMLAYRQQQVEQTVIEKFYTKQPISYTGQKDISNSIWVDTEQYAAKKRPGLLLSDLQSTTRNGVVEAGQSPFDKQDFIRMDGQTVKIAAAPSVQPKRQKKYGKEKY